MKNKRKRENTYKNDVLKYTRKKKKKHNREQWAVQMEK